MIMPAAPAGARTIGNGLLFGKSRNGSNFRFGVDSRMAEFFQQGARAVRQLSGSRRSFVFDRRWVER
jgi:hypothetical protein